MDRRAKRAGDDDRAGVADELRVALDQGRLELHEYDDRLQRAYVAKTYAELDELVHDLPTTPPGHLPAPQVRPAAPPHRPGSGAASWQRIAVLIAIVVA